MPAPPFTTLYRPKRGHRAEKRPTSPKPKQPIPGPRDPAGFSLTLLIRRGTFRVGGGIRARCAFARSIRFLSAALFAAPGLVARGVALGIRLLAAATGRLS